MAQRAPLLVLLPALLAPACQRPGNGARPVAVEERVDPVVLAPDEIRAGGALPIAAVFPTIGRYAVSGLQSLQGARLAVEDVNREGGVNGRPLRLADYRTGSYFVDARRAASLAAADGALAIVGANSSELSSAVAEEAEAEGILQISNVSTAADLTWDPKTGRDRPFVFRMCASDDVMGELLAGFARDRLGAKRAAVLYEVGRTYSQRLARSFTSRFSDDVAGHVVAEFFYLALETDFRPQLRLVKEFRPDVLFVPGLVPRRHPGRRPGGAGGAARDHARRRRLVEPVSLPARRPAGDGVLRGAVLAGPGVRPPLREGRGAGAAQAAAPCWPTTPSASSRPGFARSGRCPTRRSAPR